MDWLREYATPLACSFLLHFGLLIWLAVDFAGTPELPEVKQPKFIKASVVKLKPEQKKSVEPKKTPKKAPPKKVEPPKQVVKKPVEKKAEPPKVDPNKKKKEEELKKQQALEKIIRLVLQALPLSVFFLLMDSPKDKLTAAGL